MTHAERVEKMALELFDAYWMGLLSWSSIGEDERDVWRKMARLALAQHPAVEVLRHALSCARPFGACVACDEGRSLLADLGKDGE